jgi:hypothetical protein
MRQGEPDRKIWPPIAEAFYGCSLRDVQGVTIRLVDLSERLNEIRCVALVAAESSPN